MVSSGDGYELYQKELYQKSSSGNNGDTDVATFYRLSNTHDPN